MSCKSCTDCKNCNKKEKPKDCKGDSCGRCCGNSCANNRNNEFLIILLEKQFLPCLFIDDKIIYKENEYTNEEEINSFYNTILSFSNLGYLTIDTDEELDEFSYLDYSDIFKSMNVDNTEVTKGTLSITQKCIDVFTKTSNIKNF